MINVKTDRDVKVKAQKIAKEMGLPLSTVINAYLREFVRDEKVTFSLKTQLRPEVVKLLKKASADFKKGKNHSPIFTDPDEMLNYLHSK